MDFWIQCPSCKGTASYETRLEASCETCDDRGVVRLTPENCQHEFWYPHNGRIAFYVNNRRCRWCGTESGVTK